MKQLLLLTIVLFVVSGCASFNPGAINIQSASSSPNAVTKDGVTVLATKMSAREAKRVYDANLYSKGINAYKISIANDADQSIDFDPNNVRGYQHFELVHDSIDFSPVTRLFVWSIPWILNVASGYPIYYGILWPITGIIDYNGASNANLDRAEFIEQSAIKPVRLQPGKSTQGILFINRAISFTPELVFNLENGEDVSFELQ